MIIVNIDFGNIIALCAFFLAAHSTKKTFDFNRRQKEIIEIQDSLNKTLLRREQKEAIDEFCADISANFIKIGTNKRRLKVFNKGKGTAKNVNIEFPDGNELLMDSEVKDKFPIPLLEQFQSVELIAVTSFGSPTRITIKLIWDDEEKVNKSKIVTPTL